MKKAVPSAGETTVFAYDASGKMVAEYSTNVEPVATAKVNYLTADHLGSPRINTDASGSVTARHDYMPFGEEIDGTGGRTTGLNYGDDGIRTRFGGYQQDDEVGLDYVRARNYDSKSGRFVSPDSAFNDSRPLEPQSWNLYRYAGNNPLLFIDPTGKRLWVVINNREYQYLGRGQGLVDADGKAVEASSGLLDLLDRLDQMSEFNETLRNLIDGKNDTVLSWAKSADRPGHNTRLVEKTTFMSDGTYSSDLCESLAELATALRVAEEALRRASQTSGGDWAFVQTALGSSGERQWDNDPMSPTTGLTDFQRFFEYPEHNRIIELLRCGIPARENRVIDRTPGGRPIYEYNPPAAFTKSGSDDLTEDIPPPPPRRDP
ncbi:MAG: hypothetical protein JFAIHJKO_02125 [Pyrinomonadaceae bacterium]|nr:hypothetical protein [Pyrinomonadaceae bacterium]